jgi:DNA-binding XRE family transcriptional regulator
MSRTKTTEKPGLAERSVAVRKRLGMRQRDAAREVGISRKTFGRIENGYVAGDHTRARFRRWLETREAQIAAAAENAGAEPAAAPEPPPRPPRMPARLRLAILRKIGR